MKIDKGLECLKERPWLEAMLGDNYLKAAASLDQPRYRRHLLRWLDSKVRFIAVRDFTKLNLNAAYYRAEIQCCHPLIPSMRETLFFKVQLFVFYHLSGGTPYASNVEVGRCGDTEAPTSSWVDSNTIANVIRRVTEFYNRNLNAVGKTLCWDAIVVKTSVGEECDGTYSEQFEIYPFPEGFNYANAAVSLVTP